MLSYNYLMPSRILFGAGVFGKLAEEGKAIGERPFVVTGRHAARAAGFLDRLLEQLPEAVIYDAVEENPGIAVCAEGARRCRQAGCDYVIGLGGGSAMDAAKVIAVLAVNAREPRELFGNEQYSTPPLPILAIPTTAGTGSEVTPYSVLIDDRDGMKRTVRGKGLFPVLALMDPELTLSMPRSVTVATGLDALSQCMEGLVSRTRTAMGAPLAYEGIRLIARWLPVAADTPDHLAARSALLQAALLSGIVIAQSGTTMVHGMGYYYTLRHNLPHGLANGLLLAPAFAFNALQDPEVVGEIARALGAEVVAAASPETIAEAVGAAIHRLFERLNLSPKAADFGVPEAVSAEYAREIAGDPYRFRNQPGAITFEVVEGLYRNSWCGKY